MSLGSLGIDFKANLDKIQVGGKLGIILQLIST